MMELWKTDLEITSQYILENKVVKVFDSATFIGFFAIKIVDDKTAEIDHLWLKPENTRQHYGREIFHYITNCLASGKYKKMTLIAEPNAIGFYEKMNGKVIGKVKSKISGRHLDIYEFQIE